MKLTNAYLKEASNEQLMVELIDRSLKNLETSRVKESSEHNSNKFARQEFGHVRMSFPRSFGHTNTAIMLKEKYHKNSFLFVRDGQQFSYLESSVKDYVARTQPIYLDKEGKWDFRTQVGRIMKNVFIATDPNLSRNLFSPEEQDLIILDRASEFTYLEKAGIVALFPNAKLIIELQ